jgi:prepilin-type N-terminal cleavage/methylation domain-containing protein
MIMKKGKESGFTMIELLIALFILSFSLLAISSMVYSVMNSTSLSKETGTATTLMQDKLESLKNAVLSSLTSTPSSWEAEIIFVSGT